MAVCLMVRTTSPNATIISWRTLSLFISNREPFDDSETSSASVIMPCPLSRIREK